jgi:hypothetical protein
LSSVDYRSGERWEKNGEGICERRRGRSESS